MIEKRILKKIGIGLLIGILVFIFFNFLKSNPFFERLELMLYNNWYFPLKGETEPSPAILIVAIDDVSIERLNEPWPWRRNLLSKAIENIYNNGGAVIGLDILLDKSSEYPEDDTILAKVLANSGNVILASWIDVMQDKLVLPICSLMENAGGLGLINMIREKDGFVRRALIYHHFKDTKYPSFAMAIVSEYLSIAPDDLYKVIPTKNGTLLINFIGAAGSFPSISICDVLAKNFDTRFFKNKIVLIGATSHEARDSFPTPFYTYKGVQQRMAGVEIYANTIQTILNGIVHNNYIRIDAGINLLFILFASISIGILAMFLRTPIGIIVMLMMIFLSIILSAYLFVHSKLWVTVTPSLSATLSTFGIVILYRHHLEEREKHYLKELFSKYVDEKVVDEIITNPKRIFLGGEIVKVTVLLSDIRGFTTISSLIPPTEVVRMLNEYFQEMESIIFKYQGILDKFIGDAIMVIYGAPIKKDNDTERAIRTALEMVAKIENLRAKWQQEKKFEFEIGIGINTGEAIVGNVGSRRRMDYTAIGNDVNITFRLEELTRELSARIIISESTYKEVKDIVEVEDLGKREIRGREGTIRVYKLIKLKEV